VRIGLLTTSFPRHAGDYAGSFVGDRARGLLDQGHAVDVLAAGDRPGTSREGRLTVTRLSAEAGLFYGAGAPETLERDRTIWWPAARFSAALVAAASARATTWDALESHWLVPCALAASIAAPGLPRRAFSHSGDVALLERIPLGRTLARRLARDGTALRFVSADLQARFARLAGAHVGEVEALEVPPSIFHPRSPGRAAPDVELRRRLGLSRPTVLAVGRLVPIKGHVRLVHACARAPAVAPQLVILGDGPERGRLERLAAALGVPLMLPGFVPRDEVARWLRAADLFAQPSIRLANGRSEGAPMAAREAQRVGVPIVATADLSELVRAVQALPSAT
jgi:glycosyltransferase involved in cell wall biosynthesis